MGERWCGGRGKLTILGVRNRNCMAERKANLTKLQLWGPVSFPTVKCNAVEADILEEIQIC